MSSKWSKLQCTFEITEKMVLQTAMSSTELMLAWCIASAAPYGLDAAFLNV
jgi:hypothetical protein